MIWLMLVALLLSSPADAQMQRQLRGGSKKPPAVTHFVLLQQGGKITLQNGGGSLICTGPC